MFIKRATPILLATFLAACASTGDQGATSTTPEATASTASSSPSSTRGNRRIGPDGRPAPMAPHVNTGFKGAPSMSSVYFDYDMDEIRPEYRGVIEEHAKYLQQNPQLKARIEGNADERGSREYNVALGQRRAEAVMKRLVLLGVSERRLEAISLGEEKPRSNGHDEAAYSENRRGDMVFDK